MTWEKSGSGGFVQVKLSQVVPFVEVKSVIVPGGVLSEINTFISPGPIVSIRGCDTVLFCTVQLPSGSCTSLGFRSYSIKVAEYSIEAFEALKSGFSSRNF